MPESTPTPPAPPHHRFVRGPCLATLRPARTQVAARSALLTRPAVVDTARGPLVTSSVSGGSDRSRGQRSSGRKEIFCAFGIDVDAVAGWLGSYGGEDSPCDISRGLFSGEVGVPRLVELFPALRHPDDLVHSWPLGRDLPRPVPHGRRRRTRDRCARILARKPHCDDPRAGNRGARQVHRPHRAAERAPSDRLRRAVVGVQPPSPTSCCSSAGSSTTTA